MAERSNVPSEYQIDQDLRMEIGKVEEGSPTIEGENEGNYWVMIIHNVCKIKVAGGEISFSNSTCSLWRAREMHEIRKGDRLRKEDVLKSFCFTRDGSYRSQGSL